MKLRTKLTKIGRQAAATPRTVNLPVTRASTVLFENLAEMDEVQRRFDADEPIATYAIANMPLRAAFEEMMVALEGGHRAATFPSGLAACAGAVFAAVSAGEHLLVADCIYGPARRLIERTLARLGIEATFFDPLMGEDVAALFRPNTRAVYLENPGSYTFEVQDFPAIARVAHARGAVVIQDNTWATGLFFPAFEHGADLVVQAATKYPAGHSDLLLGAVVANETAWPRLRDYSRDVGQTASPDDLFLALRGLRTFEVRLRQHEASAAYVARELRGHPGVRRVLHPALPEDPGHALWKRDFRGSTGLFGLELETATKDAATFVESLELFELGYSWGGFESLALPAHLGRLRTCRPWTGGPLIRLQIGLEDPEDLLADLLRALERLK